MILDVLFTPWALLALPVLYYLLPYLRDKAIRDIPAPFPAQFSNLWLLWQVRKGSRYLAVHDAHKKMGKMVRIQPHHVSIADVDAIPLIYGHGNGFLKSEYYDAFVSIQRGLFNTRDRAEHTRKRKTVAHTFSAKSIGQFEQYMHGNLELLVKQWDRMAKESGGYAHMDALHWFNYLAFDIIGDLAFGAPFGMLEKGKDFAEVRESPDAPPRSAPAIEVLNRRGEVSAAIGCMPWIKPWAKYFPDPFFSKGVEAVENLAGIAVARVKQRLDNADKIDRVDLLARLMEGKDETGEKLGRQELTAEALTQLIAGSDTTSNTSCALLYHCLRNPHVITKLQKELDAAIPNIDTVPEFSMVRDLPYLDAVIKETMRIHSTSSLGLPRMVVGPGITILNRHFPAGTVLSVPSYSIHHSTDIWGPDADAFRPERWERVSERQKQGFIPFSYGPRACVGRNVAEMELALIVSTVFRRYEFELRQGEMETREGFLRKPLALEVGMRKRVA
ncbi:benzoate 4-monooxygenase [Diplodia corticola]|uniref:Benzoate 4-monooxygenase bphA n=1 Tax=Diplodia corticola TaxID=236234 RepID=A0A1J9QZH8_9PEZI|nr:benzoate 4-monooxygenase [Diplodia corticola]OJD33800.1 benzoate 4-monooxygenase [Diplodia corticola]